MYVNVLHCRDVYAIASNRRSTRIDNSTQVKQPHNNMNNMTAYPLY